jgi:ABC-type multidrug transport system fused ATPase/permease subunit
VFSRGQVIEDGSHHELLSRGGAYAELWSAQSRVGDAA